MDITDGDDVKIKLVDGTEYNAHIIKNKGNFITVVIKVDVNDVRVIEINKNSISTIEMDFNCDTH